MNEVLDSIHRLRSVREFSEQPVSDRNLQTILQAGARACNASARQSYSIIVIKNRKTIEEYVGFSASVALLFCVDFNRITEMAEYIGCNYQVRPIEDFITGSTDTILVAQNCMLAAHSLGISGVFTNKIHRLNINQVYKKFHLPRKYCFPLVSLALGYSNVKFQFEKDRLEGPGIIHQEKYTKIDDTEKEKIVKAYDDPERHIGISETWREEGHASYLSWFYNVWCKSFGDPNSRICKLHLRHLYKRLEDAGLF